MSASLNLVYTHSMQHLFKKFLSSFGDLLVVWPSRRYHHTVYGNTVESRSKATWDRVGQHLRTAMNRYDQKTQKQ